MDRLSHLDFGGKGKGYDAISRVFCRQERRSRIVVRLIVCGAGADCPVICDRRTAYVLLPPVAGFFQAAMAQKFQILRAIQEKRQHVRKVWFLTED